MMNMSKVNYITYAVFLFLFCWSDPVFGIRNKFGTLTPADAPIAPNVSCPQGPPPSLCKDFIKKYHYKCEDHNVTTDDGFIISLTRIPSGKSDKVSATPNSKPKPAVLLQHGVFCDGILFLMIGEDSPAFFLADNGFDVWIANSRGTKYSRGHTKYNTFQGQYWDWSWDDLAKYETPAMVEYVRNHTKHDKIHYVGHSMGTLTILGALADHLPVEKQLKTVTLLCPIAYLNHITTQLGSVASNTYMAEMSRMSGMGEMNVLTRAGAEIIKLICEVPGVNCSNFLNMLTGQNCCITAETIDTYLAHEPQSTSTKVLVHLAQNVRTGVVSKFDYGNFIENQFHYGSNNAPVFNLSDISPSMPLYIAYGGLDYLADFVDVKLLLKDLKNHNKGKITTSFTLGYAHMDYVMAHGAKKIVYEPLLEFLKKNK